MGKLFLTEVMSKYKLESHFVNDAINLIVAPTGSGKTTYIFDYIKQHGRNSFNLYDGSTIYDEDVIYVVDTSNLRQAITLAYGNQLIDDFDLTDEEVFITFENDAVYCKNGMRIMTYYALNQKLENGEIFLCNTVIFDEFHSLFRYKNSNFGNQYRCLYKSLRDLLELNNRIIALTATPDSIFDEYEVHYTEDLILDVIPDEYSDELISYTSQYQINYNDPLKLLNDLPFNKALIYFAGSIDKLKELHQVLSEQFNVSYIISKQRESYNQEMKKLADSIIKTGLLPDDLDILIVNQTFETGIDIIDERVDTYLSYSYNSDFLDDTAKIQSRGRIRHDITYHCNWTPIRKLTKEDKKLVENIYINHKRVQLLDDHLNKRLSSDAFKELCHKLEFKNPTTNKVQTTVKTIKPLLNELQFDIIETKSKGLSYKKIIKL